MLMNVMCAKAETNVNVKAYKSIKVLKVHLEQIKKLLNKETEPPVAQSWPVAAGHAPVEFR